jgi:hypothetical protein
MANGAELGDAELDGLALALGDAECDGDSDADGLALPLGLTDALSDKLSELLGLTDADTLGLELALGDTLGLDTLVVAHTLTPLVAFLNIEYVCTQKV